jgi:hypothetical protein
VPISVLYDIINQLNNGNLEIIEVEVEWKLFLLVFLSY